MPHDPVTGPFTRERFAELVAAPYGEATKAIRKIDPLWGRAEGEKFRWKVEASGTMRGVAYVEAADREEADKLADDLGDNAFDWTEFDCGFDIVSVEPDSKP